ncbi:hypothetical protein [Streptomyces xantholiticus]|uniref:Uncharacterized protein n=1 Tax=Streptomyces xantholiticus TaxID=68285 RepID=A0ABV1V103_9ACTN
MARTTFPNDLVQAQRDWDRTYRALAAPHPHRITPLRRRLLELSGRIFWHSSWPSSGGHAPAGWSDLRAQARDEPKERPA